MQMKKATIGLIVLAVIGVAACGGPEEPGPEASVAETGSQIGVTESGPGDEVAQSEVDTEATKPALGLIDTPNDGGMNIGSSVGELAPNFRLETDDGNAIVLSDFRGTPVLLNFFAVWCGPCRYEMPAIQDVADRLVDELAVLAVDIDEPKERVAAYREILGLSFPMVLDDGAVVTAAYEVRALPSTYLIDAGGVIRSVRLGAFPSEEHILRALEGLGL